MLKAPPVKKKSAGKRGPKPKPPEQVRNVMVAFVVTAAEREKIEAAAAANSATLSDFARDCVLKCADRAIRRSGE